MKDMAHNKRKMNYTIYSGRYLLVLIALILASFVIIMVKIPSIDYISITYPFSKDEIIFIMRKDIDEYIGITEYREEILLD